MSTDYECKRRDFLAKGGLSIAALSLGTLIGNANPQNASAKLPLKGQGGFPQCLPEADPAPPNMAAMLSEGLPWPYVELDPLVTARLAHESFYMGACCYGVFNAVVSQWASKHGEPFSSIPTAMMKYGEGGLLGWGSVCGTLNGASAAISLVCPYADAKKLINEIVAWYADTELPTYVPEDSKAIETSKANSPLCHVSVSRWCDASNEPASSSARKERCARLVADVASKAVSLLTAYHADSFVPEHSVSSTAVSCMSCHGDKQLDNTLGKMECDSCHTSVHPQQAGAIGWGDYK